MTAADSGEVIDAAAAQRAQSSVAGSLQQRGFGVGDRLGLCVPTSAAQLHVIGGALRSGVIPVIANVQLMPPEREPIRHDADVREWIDAPAQLKTPAVAVGTGDSGRSSRRRVAPAARSAS